MSLEKIFALIIIPIVLIGFFVFLIISGPKKIDYSSLNNYSDTLEISEKVEAMRSKSLESEGRYEELVSLRRGTKEDALLLLEAIEFQESYLRGLPYHSESAKQRLNYLKERYDQVLSEELYQSSLDKEILSQNFYDDGDYASSIEAIEEAIALQREINESYSYSTLVNVNRMAVLSRQLAYLKAFPLYKEILEYEMKIEELKNEEKWIAAADLLKKVILKQLYLNSEYRSSDLADGLKLNALKLKEIRFRSTPLYSQINDLENKADALIETDQYAAASAILKILSFASNNFLRLKSLSISKFKALISSPSS